MGAASSSADARKKKDDGYEPPQVRERARLQPAQSSVLTDPDVAAFDPTADKYDYLIVFATERRRRRRRRRSTGRPATRPATAAPASFRGARTRRAGAARARSIAARVRAATARRRRAERPPSTRLDASTLRRTRRRRGCRIDAATPSRRPSVPDGASERAALFREEGGVAGAPRPRRNGPGRQPTSDFSRDDFRRGLGDFSETRRPRPAATPRIVRGATRHVDAE
mmetsp:Transcript_32318/g.97145  ORF Transcript_32318/g.97145 Transcript_32318/m.97145 type:complete len:226 (+) Transcript_32318:182-859(+)